VVARHAKPPLELPANVGAVKEAIDRALRTRMIGE